MISDITRIDANMKMLEELFQKDDEQILKEKKMRELKQLYYQLFGVIPAPCYCTTKSKLLHLIRQHYNDFKYTRALYKQYGVGT